MSAKSRVTLADVAREAGTSTATVSYVLNDGPKPVSAERRKRVLEAIERLDYSPDKVARALRRRRSGLLGLVIPDVTLPFFGYLARSIEVEAGRHGLLVLTGNSGFDARRETATTRAFIDAGVDGLIIAGEGSGRDTFELTERAAVPAVWLHHQPLAEGARAVLSDHRESGRLATAHLLAVHGRRRIVFVGGPAARGTVESRFKGYAQAIEQAGSGVRVDGLPTDLTPDHAYRSVRAVLERDATVDGLVVGTYGQAKAAVRAVTDHGAQVPRDVSVVAFDGDIRSRYEQPILTTVQQDVARLAVLAVEGALNGEADAHVAADRPALLEVFLRIGESCGCDPGVVSSQLPDDGVTKM